MDYPSLAEAQQHQQQQPDQQQAYDPVQAQSYAAYYAAYDQYYAASGYYHQPYYPHDYSASSTAAASGPYYTEAQPESAAPPGDAAQIHHPATHAAAYAPVTEQDGYAYQAPPGLNSAAVAALTQLSQLTGTIDAAERAMAGMHDRKPLLHYQNYSQMQHGPSSNRPGMGITPRDVGRRGDGPFRGRGGNRGSHIGQPPFRRDGGGPPPSRGRGHGRTSRGRGRRSNHSAPDSQHRLSAITNATEPSMAAAPRPQRSLLPVAWCDMCRVDCNSLEILEQHKNGKRHKRTVQRVQEIQAQQKVISSEFQISAAAQPDMFVQSEYSHKDASDGETLMYATNNIIPSSVHKQKVDGIIEGPVSLESNPTPVLMETGNEIQILEGQLQLVSDSSKTEGFLTDGHTLPMEGLSKRRRTAGYDRNDRWRGSRLKMMRIGRGGRYFKSFERAQNRPFERPKGPRERPRVCTVCGITCDTMAVFECHLSGKKHLTRAKRFEGQNSVFGPITVVIPPNQPTAFPSKGPEPFFYGFQNQEALQQEAELQFHGMAQPEARILDSQQMENHALEQCNQPEHFEEAEDALPDSAFVQSSGPAEDLHPSSVDQPPAMPDLEAQPSLNYPEEDETNKSAPAETGSTSTPAFPIVEDGNLPDHGTSVGIDIVVPGLDAEEPLASNGLQ